MNEQNNENMPHEKKSRDLRTIESNWQTRLDAIEDQLEGKKVRLDRIEDCHEQSPRSNNLYPDSYMII